MARAERLVKLHALMLAQTSERRETGRPLMPGDIVQAGTGEYRTVIEAGCAVEAMATRLARELESLRVEFSDYQMETRR